MIRGLELIVDGPFARATLTNVFVMSTLSCLTLLPLYVRRLGGTEAETGLVQGVHSVSFFYTAYAIAAVGVRAGGARPSSPPCSSRRPQQGS